MTDNPTQLTLFYDIQVTRNEARQRERTLEKMHRLAEDLYRTLSKEAYYIHSPGDAFQLVQYDMSILTHEELRVILLNTRNRVIAIETIYRGSGNSAQIKIGEVFYPAILQKAASMIILHNHPSGDPTPSPDDINITRSFVAAGKLLDIEILDHLVIGQGRFISCKERLLGF